jgi:hypothetical protein
LTEIEVLSLVSEFLGLVYNSVSPESPREEFFKNCAKEFLSERSLPSETETVQLLWEFHCAGLCTRQPQYSRGTPEWLIQRRSHTLDYCRLRAAELAVLNHFIPPK